VKVALTGGIYHDIKGIQKNITAELNAVSLDTCYESLCNF
jgi:hypothetical protein